MAIRQRILAGVDTAFTRLQDLVVDVQFNQANSTSYNFATGQIEPGTSTQVGVRGIPFSESKRSRDGNRVSTRLIVRSADVPDIDTYDSFTFNGKTWNLTEYEDNGFIITINLSGADTSG